MRYFTYITEQSFKTGPNGERLFCLSGPRSRPYIIPDAETETRIYRKYVWLLRIMLGGVIVGQPFAFLLWPGLIAKPQAFGAYLVALVLASGLATRLVLAGDLRKLARLPKPMPFAAFYGELAQKHSLTKLILGLIACLMFVALGIGLLGMGGSRAPGVVCIAFFGVCSLAWISALILKRRQAA